MTKPQLYVFAGPNGAGKSTLSADMVPPGTPVFDGDLEFSNLKKVFYDLEDYKIWASVNDNIFSNWKSKIISKAVDAAFKTNFRSPDVINAVKQFMDSGYQGRVIFMGLDSVEVSIDRVSLRIKKGGHEVSVDNINNNYEKSLLNLNLYYKAFTSVHLYQNF